MAKVFKAKVKINLNSKVVKPERSYYIQGTLSAANRAELMKVISNSSKTNVYIQLKDAVIPAGKVVQHHYAYKSYELSKEQLSSCTKLLRYRYRRSKQKRDYNILEWIHLWEKGIVNDAFEAVNPCKAQYNADYAKHYNAINAANRDSFFYLLKLQMDRLGLACYIDSDVYQEIASEKELDKVLSKLSEAGPCGDNLIHEDQEALFDVYGIRRHDIWYQKVVSKGTYSKMDRNGQEYEKNARLTTYVANECCSRPDSYYDREKSTSTGYAVCMPNKAYDYDVLTWLDTAITLNMPFEHKWCDKCQQWYFAPEEQSECPVCNGEKEEPLWEESIPSVIRDGVYVEAPIKKAVVAINQGAMNVNRCIDLLLNQGNRKDPAEQALVTLHTLYVIRTQKGPDECAEKLFTVIAASHKAHLEKVELFEKAHNRYLAKKARKLAPNPNIPSRTWDSETYSSVMSIRNHRLLCKNKSAKVNADVVLGVTLATQKPEEYKKLHVMTAHEKWARDLKEATETSRQIREKNAAATAAYRAKLLKK